MCYLCLRNDLLPMSRVAHHLLPEQMDKRSLPGEGSDHFGSPEARKARAHFPIAAVGALMEPPRDQARPPVRAVFCWGVHGPFA